jgi:CubicO group peptidase (beta-lactamase class C family)
LCLGLPAFGHRPAAQGLASSLFERYLESLREQAGIPGMSALVLQDGVVVWERGFGRADIDRGIRAEPDTPYLIGSLSQIFGATLFLKTCIDEGSGSLNDPVSRWVSGFAEPTTTVAQLLAHVAPSGAFRYDPTRFAALTPVIEACAGAPYARLLADDLLSRLGLTLTVPGTAAGIPTPVNAELFGSAGLIRYATVLEWLATPYRVDSRGRATRTDVPSVHPNASSGVVTTVRDLARFDAMLRHDRLLEPETLLRAWTPAAPNLPAGLGWFVQSYGSEPIVWQFGQVPDAYSALVVKAPNRGLTFVLLANSDALAAPFVRGSWDVTASVFARLFLLVYVP